MWLFSTLTPTRYRVTPCAQDQRLSHFSDTSIPLFTLYVRVVEECDRKRLELLKGDTDQILVFVGP